MTDLVGFVRAALDEDRAFDDVTTKGIVPAEARGRATIAAGQPGVIAGTEAAGVAFRLLNPRCEIAVLAEDGAVVGAGDVVMVIDGTTRGLLSAERVALNFLQRLSGIATLTAAFVDAVRGTRARILDTRKTTPGWRALEKYAVRMGGGANHRMDLSEMALIKDNHLAAVGDVGIAVARVRGLLPKGAEVEVEADTLPQVEAALIAGADRILLDNMTLDEMRAAVELVGGRARLEASGGVTLGRVRAIAETGVDDISVGALTHSAPALDLALSIEPR
ncbi:MAG: carboxylating nicotinate-nucleotide diphosphorylase [Acidobacteria bacterium]|nr:MAG: carboxylating nicotinate-nucleotide diphosphorylase [Acidobacteriota bacterium]